MGPWSPRAVSDLRAAFSHFCASHGVVFFVDCSGEVGIRGLGRVKNVFREVHSHAFEPEWDGLDVGGGVDDFCVASGVDHWVSVWELDQCDPAVI